MRKNLLGEVKNSGNLQRLLSLISLITMAPQPPNDLWLFLHHGEKQNTSHWTDDGAVEITSKDNYEDHDIKYTKS